ncbi:MAG: UDP-N-acetylmuramoyl-L-alanine--D-glutamate ligase [Bacteroidetes bacterium]|nr:UDP-N-acetylmuramoyl-L-alanine--D-glutamate ligase [Bacteroidota bacterium]MBU2584928.1 UDP-N-acetylmuramoyl-L-alanine--D-glutamate ligase [Bacteroidota bacterium]
MKVDLRNKKVSIIGAARSGIAAAYLAKRQGAQVFLSDATLPEDHDKLRKDFSEKKIDFEFGEHTDKLYDCDVLVTSPGVPTNSEVLIKASNLGLTINSEIEFASWFTNAKIIGITGTNGKTTTTALTNFILQSCGKKSVSAGNIGNAFSLIADQATEDTIIILEISSFQLDHINSFRPNVAVLLNITPDHLERYENKFQKYIDSKFRITKNLSIDDLFIYNLDDDVILKNLQKNDFRKQSFSILKEIENGISVVGNKVYFKFNERNEELISANEILIKGSHNLYNAMAASLAAKFFGCPNDRIKKALQEFRGVEHRLEFVRTLRGVTFINDSKATNVRSTYFALNSYDQLIILILGGREKGNVYQEIIEPVKQKVKLILAIGEAKEKIEKEFAEIKKVIKCNSLEDAVITGFEKSAESDILLLSPACKSFDMFKDFEHRGRRFKEIVNEIK